MATHVFNAYKDHIGELILANDDLRIMLLSTNTTADTENDAIVYVDDISTLDEFDGANYTRKTLASATSTTDDSNDRANIDFADVTWTSLGAGTRSIQGVLVYHHVTNDSDSLVGWWLEFASNKTPDGSDFQLSISDLLRIS